jgi:DNA-binding transcriptional MerR regulator
VQQDLYTISELANLFDITPRTIRYYEEIGLMTSEHRENPHQQRCYTHDERRRLKLILRGKRLGFSLIEIRDMIHLYETNPTGNAERHKIIEYAESRLKELGQKIKELQCLKTEIQMYKEQFEIERFKKER